MSCCTLCLERFQLFHDWIHGPVFGAAPANGSRGAEQKALFSDVPGDVVKAARNLFGARAVGVSACLLGIPSRYDGASKPVDGLDDQLVMAGLEVIPVCPEVLAGLGTPRPPMEFVGGDGAALLEGDAELLDSEGASCSRAMRLGAARGLSLVDGSLALLLKDRSPSCGVRMVHVEGDLVPGQGVFSALASQAGMALFCESDLESFFRFVADTP